MGKLDRYVTGYFLSSYGICLLFFVGMFLLIDVLAKTDDLFDNAEDLREMGYSIGTLLPRYYAFLVPAIFLQVAPFVTVTAAIFAITRLRRNNELVPMLVAGRSVFRVLLPIFCYSIVLAVLMGLLQQYFAPRFADPRERLKELLFDGEDQREITDGFSVGPDMMVYVSDYDIDAKRIPYFDVTYLDRDEPSIVGRDARWDASQERFVYDVPMDGSDDFEVRALPPGVNPTVIESQELGPHDLSYSQAAYLFEQTGKPKWKVLLHYHLTFPISNLLLLLLGLPFVLRQESRSTMLGMVIAILICAAYFAFDGMMRNLGDKEVLHPVLAAWFGVVLFGSLGVVLLDNVKT